MTRTKIIAFALALTLAGSLSAFYLFKANTPVGRLILPPASPPPPIPEPEDRDNALAIIQYVNHLSWVVARITTHNDQIVLEEEYRNLTIDRLKLDTITRDEDLKQLILALLDTITNNRIDRKERELLETAYEENTQAVLMDALPSPAAVIAPNPVAIGINLLQGAITSYGQYIKAKKNLSTHLKKDTWSLDKEALRQMTNLHKELLEREDALIKKYRFDDSWRVTPEQVSYLLERLKDSHPGNKDRLLHFLRQQEQAYDKLRQYWHYRGLAEKEAGNREEALHAFRRCGSFTSIVRKDKMSMEEALHTAQLLAEQGGDPVEVARQLDIVVENATTDDWSSMYYASLMYRDFCHYAGQAVRVLEQAVDHLEFKLAGSIGQYPESVGDGYPYGKDACLYSALAICRTALFSMDPGKFKDKPFVLMDQRHLSMQEALFLCRQAEFEQVIGKRLRKEISSLRLKNTAKWGREDEFFIDLPAAWLVLLRYRETELRLYNDGGELADTVREESRGKSDAPGCVRLTFLYEADNIHDKEIKYAEIALPHPNFPATIRFNTATIREEGKTWFGDQSSLPSESATILEDQGKQEAGFRLLLR